MPQTHERIRCVFAWKVYQYTRFFARFRVVSHLIVQDRLTLYGNAERPDVTAAVEGSQRYGVFAGPERAEIHRIDLVTTVGNPVLWKHRRPRRAIDAGIGFSDLPRGIVYRKHDANGVTSDLRLAHHFHR